ncbi:MAG TPA: hypothetical protein VFS21_37505 [Roseiflexaceae bacterium]|nr:hypothetical protein [Roseiflexaceae bacterium]
MLSTPEPHQKLPHFGSPPAAALVAVPVRRRAQPTANGYVGLPAALLADLTLLDTAVGVYALVARLWLRTGAPVALSRKDVTRYDPQMSDGAAVRALDHLVAAGWLIAVGEGREKRRYTPVWGVVNGAPVVWERDLERHGRPRHIQRWRVDVALLDVAMGSLQPQPRQRATIRRYLTTPALGLADVGAYARALAGLPASSPALERLGLLLAGRAQPVPGAAELLARISQETLWDAGAAPELTDAGLRLLGLDPLARSVPAAQPLFFVPPSLIGPWISSLIEYGDPEDRRPIPSEWDEAADQPSASACHATESNTSDLQPPPNPPADGGGGSRSHDINPENAEPPPHVPPPPPTRQRRGRRVPVEAPPLPDTPSAQRLWAIGAQPASVIRYADVPLSVVEAAIADAQRRPGVRDVAAWTVYLLRDHLAYGWSIPVPAGPGRAPAAGAEDRAGYAARVRAQLGGDGLLPGLAAESAPALPAPTAVAAVPPAVAPPDASQARLERLWSTMCGDLVPQVGPAAYRTWLRGTVLVSVADGVATVLARDERQREHLERAYGPLLAERLGVVLGQSVRVVVVVRVEAAARSSDASPLPDAPAPAPRAGAPPGEHARPEWIMPDAWDALPPPLRAALAGAQLRDGRIVPCERRYLRTLCDPRYAPLVSRLLAAAGPVRSA